MAVDKHIGLPSCENISGTLAEVPLNVTPNIHKYNLRLQIKLPCAFVLETLRPDGSRFCDAPAERGSSYCRAHRALCAGAPPQRTAAAAALGRAAAEAGEPPEDLSALKPCELPEPVEESDEERIAGLGLPARGCGPEDAP